MTVQESIQALAEDMAELKEVVGCMQTAVEGMRDKNAASPPDLRPEMAEIQKQMKEMKEAIAAIQSPAPPQAEGQGASVTQVLAVVCVAVVVLMGMGWYQAREIRKEITPLINGIYTKATPESPSHSAIPWSWSWQAEQDRRARAAAEQASEGMEEEEQ